MFGTFNSFQTPQLKIYISLKIGKYEELVSKMAKDTCVEDLSKGVENFNFDDDPKVYIEIFSNVGFLKLIIWATRATFHY